MSQFEKLKERITAKRTPRDITPDQIQSFLAKCGFIKANVEGSHWTYNHPLLRGIITVPMNRKTILSVYIDLIKEALEIIEKGGDLK